MGVGKCHLKSVGCGWERGRLWVCRFSQEGLGWRVGGLPSGGRGVSQENGISDQIWRGNFAAAVVRRATPQKATALLRASFGESYPNPGRTAPNKLCEVMRGHAR